MVPPPGIGNGSERMGLDPDPGIFENGHQVGEWTTYDKNGEVYKVTRMKDLPTREKVPFNPPQ